MVLKNRSGAFPSNSEAIDEPRERGVGRLSRGVFILVEGGPHVDCESIGLVCTESRALSVDDRVGFLGSEAK
jgi:hypothetical protein